MDKQEIIRFFDNHAAAWDAEMIRHEDVIDEILCNAHVGEGMHVLDVACGTGVLIPDYLSRGVAHVTGIDISEKMAEIAARKFDATKVEIICGDVEAYDFGKKFDCIMVYNAFPHFPNPELLIKVLTGLLKPGGYLCVAHGMSREWIDRHHEGGAKQISVRLMEAERLAEIFGEGLQVTTCISDERMYQVVGVL